MEKPQRAALQRLTQHTRRLLEQEFREQLEGRYDILLDGRIPLAPGAHLSPRERVLWDKLVAAVAHKRSQGITAAAAVAAYLREAAFHTLNRFVALKMLEARKLVQECISRGEDSAGFKEFIALAPGLVALPDKGYRLYVETIFDEIAQEVRALFDRRDAATLLWPRRQALLDLLAALNDPEVALVWGEDETIGWVYQYFNGEDERRQMRAESQAPRNSRELAVRNQFFTPRYVVQFLTDNSLGRTWCEMRGADTQLAHLDYLVKPEEGFEERAPKDPRDLRVLDPACGSGHFLLYAFDLLAGDPTRSFFGIYEEAWRAEDAPRSEVTGRTLKEDYDSELALRRAVPELILEHNLHGVDIDPRAAQIAGLALWMRAQRAYNDHKVAAQDRPLIGRTNIVTAEPMPGDWSMVAEFASTLRPQVLGELFQRMVEEMRLAGELGPLLKIDRALQSAVAKAREQFLREQREPQKFLPGLDRPRNPQLEFDLSGVSDESFFDSAEERIVQALQQYAAGAPASMSVRRQLFADDAAQGIAFIDLCRKRFDVVLMNPPFGHFTSSGYAYSEREYSGAHTDIFGAFIRRAVGMLEPHGQVGCITSRSFIMRPRMEKLRRVDLIPSLVLLLDLGSGVMDAALVDAAAVTLRVEAGDVFLARDLRATDRVASLNRRTLSEWRECKKSALLSLPKSQILYSLPTAVAELLRDGRSFEPNIGTAREGMKSFDNRRFLRLAWEVEPSRIGTGREWLRFAKGGPFAFLWGTTEWLLKWKNDGAELQEINRQLNGSTAQVRQASTYWFRPGATYTYRSSRGFSARVLPSDFVFSNSGPAILLNDALTASQGFHEFLLGWLNSRLIRALASMQANAGKFLTGIFKKMPWIEPSSEQRSQIVEAVHEGLVACLDVDQHVETCPFFVGPAHSPSPDAALAQLRSSIDHWRAVVDESIRRCSQIVDDIYGLDSAPWADDVLADQSDGDEESSVSPSGRLADDQDVANRYCSWAIGVVLGRWSSHIAPTASSAASPFAALPSHPPALSPKDSLGVVADDPGHSADIVKAAHAVLRDAFGEDFVEKGALREDGIRNRIRDGGPNGFWARHLSTYSSKERQAPIYWQLATASGSYSVWIYIHRATGDTLFRVLNDFVGPKIDHENAKLDGLTQEAGANPSAAQRHEIEQQETFVGELQALKTEVARVAPLWKPNLDDGVILNFAPLWRLVPQSRSWQGECKKAWDKLVAGDYDWAHIAMHLWPERVVPKCIDDRSLAIAHGLDDAFWHEDDSGTWHKNLVDDAHVKKLIDERTSSTVKAALADLLSAPTPAGRKGRKSTSRKAKGRRPSPAPVASKRIPSAAPPASAGSPVDDATLSAVKAAIASIADGASKADVLAATGLTDAEWSKAIAALLERGDVTRTGQKRGTRYFAEGS